MLTVFLADMVTQFAQNEQNMNAVERVLVYVDLPPEGAAKTPNDPPPSWPSKGEIKFRDVSLAYRQGLPLVLNGVNFEVRAGEKVGNAPILVCFPISYSLLYPGWYSRSNWSR